MLSSDAGFCALNFLYPRHTKYVGVYIVFVIPSIRSLVSLSIRMSTLRQSFVLNF